MGRPCATKFAKSENAVDHLRGQHCSDVLWTQNLTDVSGCTTLRSSKSRADWEAYRVSLAKPIEDLNRVEHQVILDSLAWFASYCDTRAAAALVRDDILKRYGGDPAECPADFWAC
jgi:hypothetical protein